MSRFRKIDTRVWNDAKFRGLSDGAKLIFFLLLTHPGMTALGAMRANLPGLAAEMGWKEEAFREAFAEAFEKGMAEHDEESCLIAIPNFLKYNLPESPNVIKAWVAALDLLPECSLKFRVIARAQLVAEGMTEGFRKAFREAFGKAMPNQEQEQEQEQEQSKDSLRSSSSAASPSDPAIEADKNLEKRQRLSEVCDAATDAYNAICAKPHGLMPKATPAGRDVRLSNVKRALKVASNICVDQYGDPTITAAFWEDYFKAIQADEFKSGRQAGGRGHEGWLPDFEYLTRPKVILETFERAVSDAAIQQVHA